MSAFVIEETLELLRSVLEQALKNAIYRTEPWFSLSNAIDNEGRPFKGAENRVVMFLANITRENVVSTYRPSVPAVDGKGYVAVAPPLHVDLHLLFYANFIDEHYRTGLKVASWILGYFQQNPRFDHDSLPGLDPGITQLTFELQSLETTDLNYLMGLLGTKYLPSAFYKVRLITFDGNDVQAQIPEVGGYGVPSKDGGGAS